jgi:hypothetical protein
MSATWRIYRVFYRRYLQWQDRQLFVVLGFSTQTSYLFTKLMSVLGKSICLRLPNLDLILCSFASIRHGDFRAVRRF